jgi:N-methylhydantoinase A
MAAWGVHDLVNEQMASEVRAHVAEQGGDVRRATLVAFGGAGPVHADGLARKLRVARLLVPLRAGIAPTLGFLVAPVAFDVVRSLKIPLESIRPGEVDAIFASMADEALSIMRNAAPSAEVELSRSVDICYHRQGYGLTIPLPDSSFDGLLAGDLVDRFGEAYRERYGYAYADQALELLVLRLRASTEAGTLSLRRLPDAEKSAAVAVKGRRPAYSASNHGFVDHTVYEREELVTGAVVHGPAIVEERESTLIIGDGGRAIVDAYGNLIVDLPIGGQSTNGANAGH